MLLDGEEPQEEESKQVVEHSLIESVREFLKVKANLEQTNLSELSAIDLEIAHLEK